MSWKACLLIAALAGLPHAALAQSNLQCKSTRVEMSAHLLVVAHARVAAMAAWTTRTTALYGSMWANWTNAANPSVTCRMRTMPTGINGHFCTASARPCRLQ